MTHTKSITAQSPATIANLGPGFDCLGMAITGLSDMVTATLAAAQGMKIRSITGTCEGITTGVKQNTAGLAVQALLRATRPRVGIVLDIKKGIPAGSGLGSSAASATAAVFAVNHLLKLGLSPHELISFAMQGERASAGAPHADNVACALLGSVTIVRSVKPLDVVTIQPSSKLRVVIASPNCKLDTRSSRAVLPAKLSLDTATRQWSNIAGLVAGLCLKDNGLISRSMEDVIVEPARKRLIPHLARIKRSALRSGALGCTISGGGPTVFALAEHADAAKYIANAIKDELFGKRPRYDIFVASVNRRGTQIIKR